MGYRTGLADRTVYEELTEQTAGANNQGLKHKLALAREITREPRLLLAGLCYETAEFGSFSFSCFVSCISRAKASSACIRCNHMCSSFFRFAFPLALALQADQAKQKAW